MHAHRPTGRGLARGVGGAQPGERCIERVDRAEQEGAGRDPGPSRVQEGPASRDGAHEPDRATVAQKADELTAEVVGDRRGLGLDELVPAVDEHEDRGPLASAPVVRRPGAACAEPTVDLVAQVPQEGRAAPGVVGPDPRADVGERVEVGQRPVRVDYVQVQGVGADSPRRPAPAPRRAVVRPCRTRRRAATTRAARTR